MSNLILAGKRLALLTFSTVSLLQISAVGTFFLKWAHHWNSNSAKIITLTTINTTMTFGSEFISRTVLSKSLTNGKEYQFIVGNGAWYRNINRQPLINIWMTFFASLLGAPVYFFGRRRDRYLFFIGFGVFNSALSQGLLSFLKDGFVFIAAKRLFFDFIYNGTLKFAMFEFYRKPIKYKNGFFKLYFIRGKQDVLTAFIKNLFLNLLRFKG